MTKRQTATDSLAGSIAGDTLARARLIELLYEDLRSLASSRMRGERRNHTLQPTALAHEAFVRLIGQDDLDPRCRTHFFALAATSMRHILVDHARSKLTRKRGDGQSFAALGDEASLTWDDPIEVLALDEALEKLAKAQPRQAQIVELRFFAGMTLEETAEAMDVSRETVKLDWRFARAWLNRELAPRDGRD